MKKVLVIAPYSYLPYFSGGQKFIAKFLEYLAKDVNLTVVTVAENDFSLAKYKYLPWLKKKFSRYLDISLANRIVALIKKEKYDFVIWEHPYYAWAAFLVKKQTGIKTIIHSHNIEHQRFKGLGKWWWPILSGYEKWFFSFADYIFFITPADKQFAIEHWHVPKEICIDVPFGIELNEYPKDKQSCKKTIKSRHNISGEETIILFNGALNYKPNLEAVVAILEKVNPILLSNYAFKYKIIICGKGLPAEWNELKDYADKNIIYAGFVDDIDTYFKGADLFLNPVQSGGGIKTKMVEAIGFGTTVIATETGAIGIRADLSKSKLVVIHDDQWNLYADSIIQSAQELEATPQEFYQYYFYRNVISNALREIG
jgi:glycosyltransferase involved in cell wall biosynthesis